MEKTVFDKDSIIPYWGNYDILKQRFYHMEINKNQDLSFHIRKPS